MKGAISMKQSSGNTQNFIIPPKSRFIKPSSIDGEKISYLKELEQIRQSIEKGEEKVVIATFKNTPKEIIEKLKNKKIDYRKLVQENKVVFVNFASAIPLQEVSNNYNLFPITMRIEMAIKKNNASKVILCETDSLKKQFPSKNIDFELEQILSKLKVQKVNVKSYEN